MTAVALRRCPKCGWAKPIEAFGRSKQTSDGLVADCRDCMREYFRGWKAKRKLAQAQWLEEKKLRARRSGVRVIEETTKQENAGR